MWANSQSFLRLLSLCCVWATMVLWWFPYPRGRHIGLGLLTEWISGGDTAAFSRHIVNTSVGASLTDTTCLDIHEVVCNEEKAVQGSRICVVMFVPWVHAGLTCVGLCSYIRFLLHSDGQRKGTSGTRTSLRLLCRLLVKDIDGATSFTYRVESIIQQFILPASRTHVR